MAVYLLRYFYQAMRQQIEPSRRLLSISTNFVGPLLADTDFSLKVEVLREGKNSTQVLAKAVQSNQVERGCTSLFCKITRFSYQCTSYKNDVA